MALRAAESAGALPLRARLAVVALRAMNAASRRLGAGAGTVAGGNVGLALDPDLLGHLGAGRRVALVSGTNGKTTTTRLLAVAVEGRLGRAAVNATGSNMPSGHVTALAAAAPGAPAVLEVDEGYVPELARTLSPGVVVLLNLSRDQLDRTNEVRMVANRWRAALSGSMATAVVANADDPLVAWAAGAAVHVVWVGAGLSWRADAVGCPSCEGSLTFAKPSPASSEPTGWSCSCGFARPEPDVWLEGDDVVLADGRRLPLELRLPGRFNRANAAMAAAGAEALGVPASEALERMEGVEEVAGRFGTATVAGCSVRLMLAKNPAGWRELLELLCPAGGSSGVAQPLVVGINARVADGRDPSWLWDVPFERLHGRLVVATGERCRDLAVRLRYADVEHECVRDPVAAVLAATRGARAAGNGTPEPGPVSSDSAVDGGRPRARVDFVGNYTAFYDLLARAAPGPDGRGGRW